MKDAIYDVIVIGLGIHGAAIARSLAHLGMAVLGVDMLAESSRKRSSYGRSRIFRYTVIEGDAELELAWGAANQWHELNAQFHNRLITPTGLAIIADLGSRAQLHHGVRDVLAASVRVAENAKVPYSLLTGREFASLAPALNVAADDQPSAFLLDADSCRRALTADAVRHGAELRYRKRVLSLRQGAHAVTLETEAGTIRAKKVVVSVGPWTPTFLPRYRSAVRILPQPVRWYAHSRREQLPFVMMRRDEPLIFGIPETSNLRLGLENLSYEVSRPGVSSRFDAAARRDLHVRLAHMVASSVRDLGPLRRAALCHYTVTRDGRPLVEQLDGGRIVVVSACSGHGFKYAPQLAQRIAARIQASS
jgi:glycine/D-amino acid oxidase-like deaminating enzyme